ncbi:WD40 repeat-containing protein [Thermochaetoides thermophila DSM 1495]|uniref:WD40 repeat-containing protein n=1 Tax=Chaetomium thermophilum (strain DSM 1495 / CBS 144.50 / IMI 039719) TaxID=759272 RepID=G0S0H2_CHATD|nr:WD40 repeat-containing protein [Thermochaetoides thermophila DSM 1495]EGS23333.1 WD40 repeat-containing protein [Thermochaetoides thermophila DSM 1495]
MAPPVRSRYSRIPKEKFSAYFGPLKSQPYNDSTSRGGSHHSLRTLAWNPLGTLIATGASDKTLRVWNPEKPNVRFSTELKGHTSGIEKIAFNPVKDAELCSVSNDGVVKFWDVRTKACVNEVKGLGNTHALAWAPDGSSLLVGNRAGELFQLLPTKSSVVSSHQQPVETNQMAFAWTGDKVFLPTNEGRVRILSYPGLEPVLHVNHAVKPDESTEFTLKGHTAPCLTVELSPTGRYLATGGADSIIALFDTKDWICQRTVSCLVGPVKSISFTFDGSYVVGGCEEGSGLEVTHTETGEHVHTFKTAGPCEAVAWAPTRYCLAYSDLGVLRIIGLDADRK